MRVVLTQGQREVLAKSSFAKPIYAYPNKMTGVGGHFCGNPGTIKSLVKRGLLTDDGRAGFLLTRAGAEALRACGPT
jgi:hypothetical protein